MKDLIKIISKFKGSKYAFLINDVLNVFDIDNFFKYSTFFNLEIETNVSWKNQEFFVKRSTIDINEIQNINLELINGLAF